MGTTSEKVAFEAELDASGFNAQVGKMRNEVKKTGVSINDSAGGMRNLTESTDKSRAALGGAATAMSGFSGAAGGAAGSTASVVGAVDNLVNAMAQGGPLALALVASTIGIGLLIDKWVSVREAAKKAKEEQISSARALLDGVKSNIEGLRDALLEKQGVGATDLAVKKLDRQTAAITSKIKDIEAEAKLSLGRSKQGFWGQVMFGKKGVQQLTRDEEELIKKLKADRKEINKFRDQISFFKTDELALSGQISDLDDKKKADEKAKLKWLKRQTDQLKTQVSLSSKVNIEARNVAQAFGASIESARLTAGQRAEQQENLRASRAMETADAQIFANNQVWQHQENLFDLELARMQQDAAKKKQIGETIRNNQTEAFAQSMEFGLASADMIGSAMDGIITGQVSASEAAVQLATGMIAQIGRQLVAVGAKQMFEGGGIMIASGGVDPRGAGLMALGGAAVASGIGMGALATGIGHVAGARQTTRQAGAQAATDTARAQAANRANNAGGVSSGALGAASGGGGPVVQQFVFNGPAVSGDTRAGRWMGDMIRDSQKNTLEVRP